MNFNKQLYSLMLLLFLGSFVSAQEEERFRLDSADNFSEPSGAVHFLKLRKSYSLGSGVAIRSAHGSLIFTQSLQTLYSINSAYKNISNLTSSFEIRRARLTLVGNLFDNKLSTVIRINYPVNYQSTTSGNRSFNNTLQEAYVEYRPNSKHTFNLGLRADYVDSRETRIEGESLGFTERSALSGAFDAIFDYGIRYKGKYKLGGKHILKPYISFTSGDSRSALQKNFGGFKYGARIDYLPFDEFSKGGEYYMEDLQREQKPKLVMGVVASFNDGISSAYGTNGGRFIYGDTFQNVLLPTFTKFGFDYMFKYKGFYSLGAFFATQAVVPDNIKGEFRLNGQFNKYNINQTVEQTKNIVLSRMNLGTALNVQMGYVFANDVALGLRYSQLNSNTQSAKFDTYNKYYAFVFTKYLADHNCKFQVQIGYDELNDPILKQTQDGNYYTQFMFTVQL